MRTSAAVSGKRLIDDVHILASQNDFSAIMFANRKAILRALEQQDVDENEMLTTIVIMGSSLMTSKWH